MVDPAEDTRRDYPIICDVSGDASLIDTLIGRLARGGEIVLAGFYDSRSALPFRPPSCAKRACRSLPSGIHPTSPPSPTLVETGKLSLDGLITHCQPAAQAEDAYRTAFGDPGCLKMILDWRSAS